MLGEEQEQLIPIKTQAYPKGYLRLSSLKNGQPEIFDVESALAITFQRKFIKNPFYMFWTILLVLVFFISIMHFTGLVPVSTMFDFKQHTTKLKTESSFLQTPTLNNKINYLKIQLENDDNKTFQKYNFDNPIFKPEK